MVNSEKLQYNLQYITDHPEEWYQNAWGRQVTGCGTAFCLAGHAVVHDGYELAWEKAPMYDHVSGKTVEAWFANETVDGQSIPELAREILGLEDGGYGPDECTCYDDVPPEDMDFAECYCDDDTEGHYLFETDRKLEDMWGWAERNTDGKVSPRKDTSNG